MKSINLSLKRKLFLSISLSVLLTGVISLESYFAPNNKVDNKSELILRKVAFASSERQTAAINITKIQIEQFSTFEEMLTLLEKNDINQEDFLSLSNNVTFYEELSKDFSFLPEYNKDIRYLLEGYILPGEYQYEKGNLKSLIYNMLETTQRWLSDATNNFQNELLTDYSISEIITLASIVEKESSVSSDRKLIAGVFFNRLEQGMPLQSDVTVLYALQRNGGKVLYKDLKASSPYNTYFTKDIPIGPINTPSTDSLLSVLNSTHNNYLFFFGTGVKTVFSSTFEEHKQTIAKYRKS